MADMERQMKPIIQDGAVADISAISVEPVASVDKCSAFTIYLLTENRSKLIVLQVKQ